MKYKVTIDGTERQDIIKECVVDKSLGNYYQSWTAKFRLNNVSGDYSSTFAIGDAVVIYYGITTADTIIFRGEITSITPDSSPGRETLNIIAKDLTHKLQAITVFENYLNTEVSAIVKDLISKYASYLTTTNVQTTSVTLQRQRFFRKPLHEVLRVLAENVGYQFYINTSNDLVFKPEENTLSGISLDSNTNIIKASKKTDDKDLANRVWVYGGKFYYGYKESFDTVGTGSVFTLAWQPHDTEVTVDGTIQKGGVFEFAGLEVASGTNYLVDYDQKYIIFVSGTVAGNHIPASGAAIIVSYNRGLPIIRVRHDLESQALYGIRDKVINNEDITNPLQAEDVASQELEAYKNPLTEINVDVRSLSIVDVPIGQTVAVNVPEQGINNENLKVISVNYNFTAQSLLSGEVISIKLSNKLKDVTDIIRGLLLDVKQLQAQNVSTTDVVTNQFAFNETIRINPTCIVKSRAVGSSFILGHEVLGILGAQTPQPLLGDQSSSWVTNFILPNNSVFNEYLQANTYNQTESTTATVDYTNHEVQF